PTPTDTPTLSLHDALPIYALPLQLGEGVVPRRHLREGLLGLAPCGATMGLLLLELGHAPPRLLQAGRRLRRRAGQRRRLLRPREIGKHTSELQSLAYLVCR